MLTNADSNDVFILGAGFSRALSDHMPLTDELGNAAAAQAKLDIPKQFTEGRFESWLSRLAEPQPDLTHMQNADNAAAFAKLQWAIHSTMVHRQTQALREEYPSWASDFVAALHASRATVVSFNYDLSVEWLFDALSVWDFETGEQVRWWNILRDLPPFPPVPARWSGPLRPSMHLLKLHGSLNWYWVPGDTSGLTIHKWELQYDEVERLRHLPGRQPFIVPPMALKSAYFSNPVVREMWQQAAAALRRARRVFFVGYSVPITDMVVAGMISDALADSQASITIVNPNPDPVGKSLRHLLGRDVFSIVDTVERAAVEYVQDTSVRHTRQLMEADGLDDDAPLLVGWSPDILTSVSSLRRVGPSSVELTCKEPLGARATWPREVPSVTVGGLVGELRKGDLLQVALGASPPRTIVGLSFHRTLTGASNRWQVLVPAGTSDLAPPGSEND